MVSFLISCGESKKKTEPEVKTVSSEPVIQEPAKLEAEFKDSLVAEAYKNYNAIKSGLVNSDAAKTQEAAKALLKNNDQLEFTDEMKKAVSSLAKTNELKKQRLAFQAVTAEMTKLVENNLISGKLYYQFCPMAFGGKGGFWLSNSKEIKNPYYGVAMLGCGEVRKVIE